MLNVKGFISIDALVDNAVGTIGALGELSTYGATFTTKIAEYSSSTIPDLRLITTHTVDDANGQAFSLLDAKALHILQVAKWIYDYNKTHTNNYTPLQLLNDFQIAFPAVSSVSAGAIVSDAANWLPEFVAWSNVTLGNYQIKIWFSDTAFRTQYDESSTVVVAPLDPLDKFFGSAATVVANLASVSIAAQMNKVNTIKATNPETVIRAYQYNYVAPGTGAKTLTTWYAIIYGPAGDNEDTIKQTFIDYALTHSSHNQQEWTAIMPDLFLSTEFTIVPRWNEVAIPVMNLQAGMYSSIVNPGEVVAEAQAAIPNYTANTVAGSLQLVPNVFKSILLMVVGGPQNRDNKYHFSDYFDDYILVGTQSTDFGRQRTSTQNFAELVEKLLITAEGMTAFSALPEGQRRVIRNERLYVAANLDNILYLVQAKASAPVVQA